MVRPKYQVFVSSTFQDLAEERREVMWQILKARHIPAGMEWFPSTSDRGWEIIQRMIDQADYYVLLLAGRYGTVDPKIGMSWTEREYHYANQRGLPVLAFVRDPSAIVATKMESEEEGKQRLAAFTKLIRETHLAQLWKQAEDLGALVSASLHSHIIDDEDGGRQRPGWYRGTDVPSPEALETIERLRAENERLRRRDETNAPLGPSFGQIVRYLNEIEWPIEDDDEVTLLWYVRTNAATLATGMLDRDVGAHLALHGLATEEDDFPGALVLNETGRRFLSQLALTSREELVGLAFATLD